MPVFILQGHAKPRAYPKLTIGDCTHIVIRFSAGGRFWKRTSDDGCQSHLKDHHRNPRRTILTVSSNALSRFALSTLVTVHSELNREPEGEDPCLRPRR